MADRNCTSRLLQQREIGFIPREVVDDWDVCAKTNPLSNNPFPSQALLQQLHFSLEAAKRLTREDELHGHEGCVNRMAWNEDGTHLVSGSDDRKVRPR